MSKMTIIEGNSNDKDNVRAYMVKGEPGVSPTIGVSKEDGVTTLTIEDAEGTHTATIADGDDLVGGVPTDGVIGFDGEAADIPDGYEVFDNSTIVKSFDTVADMKADEYLIAGNVCRTLGYEVKNDGNTALYNIVNDNTLEVDNYNIIDLNNGLKAQMIIDLNITNKMQLAKVHYIYRGLNAGDCSLIETPQKNILIDFGVESNVSELIQYLKDKNLKKIDYVIISHYDADHTANITGMESVLEDTELDFTECTFLLQKRLNYSLCVGDVSVYQNAENSIIEYLTNNNYEIVYLDEGQEIKIDYNNKLRFLNCNEDYFLDYYNSTVNDNDETLTSTNFNNFSIITELYSGNNVFLFAGDLLKLAQMKNYQNLSNDINVLKVQHHGVNHYDNTDYLKKLYPKISVIQNTTVTYTDKHTYNYLNSISSKIYTNNESGNIEIISRANGLECVSDNGAFNNIYDNVISENTDLDSFLNAGEYHYYGNYTINNSPTNSSFRMYVKNIANDRIYQIIITNSTNPNVYIRNKSSNGFGEWKKLAYELTKEHIDVSISSDLVLSSTDFTDLVLSIYNYREGSNLSITQNGYILIGENISTIEISGKINFDSGVQAGDRLRLLISKNNDRGIMADEVCGGSNYYNLTIPSKILNVSEGDIIKFQVQNLTQDRGTVAYENYYSYFNIKKIN